MLETLLRPAYLGPLVMVVPWVLYQVTKPSNWPKGLPVVGVRKGEWFALTRAAWRNTLDTKSLMSVVYTEYRDQAVIIPLVTDTFVGLPATDIDFVSSAPESQLSLHAQAIDNLQTDYTVMDPDLIHRPLQHHTIVTTLTNQIGNLVPDIMEEIVSAFERNWGTDTAEFKEICVYETMRHIVGQVTNRVFVGPEACRNRDLVEVSMKYAQDVPLTSIVLRAIPKLIKPILVPLITLPARIHTNQFYKLLKPTIERRLREFDARKADPEGKGSHLGPPPNDLLEWSIAQAKDLGEPDLWHPRKLAGRVLILNFAAIHTSTFSITGAILDLVCNNKPEHIAELRAEIEAVLAEHGGVWDKRSLAKMHKLDSTMRESVRLNSIVTLGLGRMVTSPTGIDTPSGFHIPAGVIVTTPGYSIMHDPAIYPGAEEFRPFRFAEQRVEKDGVGYVERARKAFPTTSKEFLAFGHGKNACPGRFFASNELKLMLGYMVCHYDFEMQTERPHNMWFGVQRVPPMKATVRVRRREKSLLV